MAPKKRILLVDDEADARMLGESILSEIYDVDVAENAVAALDLLPDFLPDVLITDIKMPGEDGLSLLAKAKAKFPEMPVILVTGHGDKDLAIKAVKEGAYDFLEKPFDDIDLLNAAKRALTYLELRQELNLAKARGIETEKLATVGIMASGVANELSTPLGTILLLCDLLKKETVSESLSRDRVLEITKSISETTERASTIVKSLTAFSKSPRQPKSVKTNLGFVVSGVKDLCFRSFEDAFVNLEIDIATLEGVVIECRSSQISQVLFNLLLNALEACSGGPSNRGKVRVFGRDVEDYYEICVSDSGKGVDFPIRRKIFDPFFTTKDPQMGTGLGLSVGLETARDHGGDLYLDESEMYTTFVLKLPKVLSGDRE